MSTIKAIKMIKLKDILLEVEKPETKIFDQGSLQDSMKQIRKLVGIEEDGRGNHNYVRYNEFRFSDGSGGFNFEWSHSIKRSGRLSLSIDSPARGKSFGQSKVTVSVVSRYGDKVFDNDVSNQSYLKNIKTWRDLDNLTMQTVISKSDSLITKFEKQIRALQTTLNTIQSTRKEVDGFLQTLERMAK